MRRFPAGAYPGLIETYIPLPSGNSFVLAYLHPKKSN
jgi:hypothetical protein